MYVVTISSKSQITLPKALLQSLDITSGAKVIIEKLQNKIIVRPLKKSIVDELSGSLREHVDKSKLGVPFDVVRRKTQRAVSAYLAQKK